MKFFLLLLAIVPTLSLAATAKKIPIKIAYREDSNPDDGRRVLLQGTKEKLENFCGSNGSKCQCNFYVNEDDTSPIASNNVYVSRRYNNASCFIPGAQDPDNYFFVKLEQTKNKKISSELLRVRTYVPVKDTIGDLDISDVRAVYRYECDQTFFEGEGVSQYGVECVPNQRLGLITAKYSFYLHNSQKGGNLSERYPGSTFDTPICEKQFARFTCNGITEKRWGLSGQQTELFQIGITLNSKPEGENRYSLYGYVALPDEFGHCPLGLVKLRPWEAQPSSIIGEELDGLNPPSSFINSGNNLNNRLVEVYQPRNFVVQRMPNKNTADSRCASSDSKNLAPGSCLGAHFSPPQQVQNVAYTGISPVVCAIPRESLDFL